VWWTSLFRHIRTRNTHVSGSTLRHNTRIRPQPASCTSFSRFSSTRCYVPIERGSHYAALPQVNREIVLAILTTEIKPHADDIWVNGWMCKIAIVRWAKVASQTKMRTGTHKIAIIRNLLACAWDFFFLNVRRKTAKFINYVEKILQREPWGKTMATGKKKPQVTQKYNNKTQSRSKGS
jgi:hypothetical protein